MLEKRVRRPTWCTPLEYEHLVLSAAVPAAAKQEFSALTWLMINSHYAKQRLNVNPDHLQRSLNNLRRALKSTQAG